MSVQVTFTGETLEDVWQQIHDAVNATAPAPADKPKTKTASKRKTTKGKQNGASAAAKAKAEDAANVEESAEEEVSVALEEGAPDVKDNVASYDSALEKFMAVYNRSDEGAAAVKDVLKEYKAASFRELDESKGPELLKKAEVLEVQFG